MNSTKYERHVVVAFFSSKFKPACFWIGFFNLHPMLSVRSTNEFPFSLWRVKTLG